MPKRKRLKSTRAQSYNERLSLSVCPGETRIKFNCVLMRASALFSLFSGGHLARWNVYIIKRRIIYYAPRGEKGLYRRVWVISVPAGDETMKNDWNCACGITISSQVDVYTRMQNLTSLPKARMVKLIRLPKTASEYNHLLDWLGTYDTLSEIYTEEKARIHLPRSGSQITLNFNAYVHMRGNITSLS